MVVGIIVGLIIVIGTLAAAASYTSVLSAVGGRTIGRWIRHILVKFAPSIARKLPKWGFWRMFYGVNGLLKPGLPRYIGLTVFVALPAKAAISENGLIGLFWWVYDTIGGLLPRMLEAVARADTIERGIQITAVPGFPFIDVTWPYFSQVFVPFAVSVGGLAWAYMTTRFLWRKIWDSNEAELKILLPFLVVTAVIMITYIHFNDVVLAFDSVQSVVDAFNRFFSSLPVVGGEFEQVTNQSAANVTANASSVG